MSFRFATIAARLLAAVPRGVGKAPPPPENERALGVLAVRQALRARARRNRRRSVVAITGTAVAMAAAMALLISFRGHLQPVSWVSRPVMSPAQGVQSIHAWGARVVAPLSDGHDGDLADGDAVGAGQSLSACRPEGARLSLSSGTVLQLAPQTRIDVQSLGLAQRFRIPNGRLHADVAPLDVGQRFLIETPDSEIEVHGTVFDLAVVPTQPGCSAATRTRVTVARGVVEVRGAGRDEYVSAGQHWPPECDALATQSAAATERAGSSASIGGPGQTTTPRSTKRGVADTARTSATASSDLATQNDLFAAAMAANKHGQLKNALENLDQLIGRFPKSQLAEAAYAERMRLRRRSGELAAARRGARAYLRLFPNGFASSEARLILGPTGGEP